MPTLRKPSVAAVEQLLASQADKTFSYSDPGITRDDALKKESVYVIDHTRIQLGEGEVTYGAAVAALQNWQQFNLGWIAAFPTSTPIEAGANVAVVARAFGIWTIHCARIVYTIDDHAGDDHAGPIHHFGFAYGTLPAHMEAGEERFQIEWNTTTGKVHYDILAFSRPRHPLTKLGYPLVRRLQKRFGRDSAARMRELAVAKVPAAEA